MYIGLKLTDAQQQMLDFTTANTENPHITLFYVGTDTDIPQQMFEDVLHKLHVIMKEYPSDYMGKYTVTDFGVFTGVRNMYDEKTHTITVATEPTDCVYYKVEGLHQFRSELKYELDKHNVYYSEDFKDFKAHITHSYVPAGKNIDSNQQFPITLTFDSIDLTYKDRTYSVKFPRRGLV